MRDRVVAAQFGDGDVAGELDPLTLYDCLGQRDVCEPHCLRLNCIVCGNRKEGGREGEKEREREREREVCVCE